MGEHTDEAPDAITVAGGSRPIHAADLGAAWQEFIRHPSARLVVAQTVAAAAWRLSFGRLRRSDLPVFVGMALWWPFQEWLVHTYLLHAPPRRIAGRRIDPLAARHHRAHHADPWDPGITLLPMWVVAPAAPLELAGWLAVMPSRRAAANGMLAGSLATLAYEWVHHLVHLGYRPRRSWFRWVQRRHRLHHFKDEHLWLGVTSPWIDDLLGTAPDPRTVATSPTVRSVHPPDAA